MSGNSVGLIDLPALRGNPFDNRPIEPSRAQDLVGRKEILHRWREYIHSGSPRMIFIIGDSGTGRTSIINAISSQTPKKFIGQFLSQEEDQAKLVLHEILTHFGTFQSIETMNQLSQKLISLFDEDKGPLPLIALDYPSKVIDINTFLSRICPILTRLRTMVIVSLTDSQYLELDEEIKGHFDEPDRLENFTKTEIQEMVNNRMRIKSKEKWIINSRILNSLHEQTGGNPRETIRILKYLVDEKRDLGYQGTLESLMAFQVNNIPIAQKTNYVVDNFVEEYSRSAEPIHEVDEIDIQDDDFIDEEPPDLWDFDDGNNLDLENLSEESDKLADEDVPILSESYLEIDDDGIDDIIVRENNQKEYHETNNETELFISPGTEPPKIISRIPPVTQSKKLGFLRRRLKKTTIGMKDDLQNNVPITYADENPSQSTLDNYVSEKNIEIEYGEAIKQPIFTEAKVDQNVRLKDYEEVISTEGAEWSVEPAYHSTVPNIISPPDYSLSSPSEQSFQTTETYFNSNPLSQQSEIEEHILEETEIQKSTELVDSNQIYDQQMDKTMIGSSSINSNFTPVWEEDKELDINRFYSLSDAERMILEAASTREISPSDDELQARLEVGRPRLSQLYNSLQKSGMLSVRKKGRTRLFKLSQAASKEF